MADLPSEPTSIAEHVSESLRPDEGMESFMEKNYKKIFGFAGAIILVFCIYQLFANAGLEARIRAAEAATSAKTVADCDSVIANHAGTVAAGNAALTKADLLWKENKKSDSVKALEAFVRDFADHPFLAQAKLGLASRLEETNRGDDARKLFEQVRDSHRSEGVGALAQLRLADSLLAAGKDAEAKAMLESFPRDFQGIAEFIEQSDQRLKWLSSGLPTKEVDPPPAPKPDPKANAAAPAPIGNLPPVQITPGGLSPTAVGGASAPQIKLTPGAPAVSAPITIPAPAAPVLPAAPSPTPPAAPAGTPK
jgi:TolA-binding protein